MSQNNFYVLVVVTHYAVLNPRNVDPKNKKLRAQLIGREYATSHGVTF